MIDQGGHASRPVIDAGAAAGVELSQVLGTRTRRCRGRLHPRQGDQAREYTSSVQSIALVEHAVFLMLGLAKNFRVADRNLRSGTMYLPMGNELAESTLGLVGFGATARALAPRASALGMQIMAVDLIPPTAEELAGFGVAWFGSPSELTRTRPSLYLQITPFLRLENVLATPHIAGVNGRDLKAPSCCLRRNVARVANGLPPLYAVANEAKDDRAVRWPRRQGSRRCAATSPAGAWSGSTPAPACLVCS